MLEQLIAAYKGYYEADTDEKVSIEWCLQKIAGHTPRERLQVYLEWNGILGYTGAIFAIATTEKWDGLLFTAIEQGKELGRILDGEVKS